MKFGRNKNKKKISNDKIKDIFRVFDKCYHEDNKECHHVCSVKIGDDLPIETLLLPRSDILLIYERLNYSLPLHFEPN